MTAPAGAFTNVGKTAIASLVGAGTLIGGVHVLDRMWGIDGDAPIVDRTMGDGTIVPTHRIDTWQLFSRTTDLLGALAGGSILLGAGASAAYDLTSGARALGETATTVASRGSTLRAGTEVALGLGAGILGAVVISALATNALERN